MSNILKYVLLIFILCLSHSLYASDSDIRIIIKYKDKNKAAIINKNFAKSFKNAFALKNIEPLAGDNYVFVFKSQAQNKKLRTQNVQNIIQTLRADPGIKYAVVDKIGYFNPIIAPPTENLYKLPSHAMQWNEFLPPQGIMLESAPGLNDGAWQYTRGQSDKDIIVAVLDTGIAQHESLLPNLLKDSSGKLWGWNFSRNNPDLTDETLSYHGTHVAGIIAAQGDYMQGVGEKLKILPIKIPSRDGMFYESWVINALYWSVGAQVPDAPLNVYPADILNMSFGVDVRPGEELDICDEALQETIDFVKSTNAVIVVAAGNDNRFEHYNAPAVCKGTLKIAATGPKGHRAYYSNYGPGINFAAPGGDIRYGKYGAILSTVRPNAGYLGTGFDFYQGTSMAAPHVAGVAGLVKAVNNQLDANTIENILTLSTHEFGQETNSNYSCIGHKSCGHGIVDAHQAIKAAIANYSYLFSAPKNNNTANLEAPWLKVNANLNYYKSRPYVYKDESGDIFGVNGSNLYKLIKENFINCDIIGVNGVGCY